MSILVFLLVIPVHNPLFPETQLDFYVRLIRSSSFLFTFTDNQIIEVDVELVEHRDLCTAEISRTCFFSCGSNAPELLKVLVFFSFSVNRYSLLREE